MLSLFCIICSQRKINKVREKDFIGTSAVLDDVPPVVAFTTIALGGFRGIAADIFWLKTISLQEEGKYFEMVQIASWILKLQPKSTGAVSFLAWNMAYNISIIYADPEKKWQWVMNGINLLRDAILYNPKNALLCKELAWIYINKIGDKYDSANLYYKTQLAFDMEKITGRELTDNENFWKLMEQVPSDYKIFLKKEPLGESVQMILEHSEYKNIDNLYTAFRRKGNLPLQIKSKIIDHKLLKSLIFYLKKRMLKEEFGLYPEKIIEINEKFGNLDWRLYSSLALYWSYIGFNITKNNKECYAALNVALIAAVLNGKLLLIDDSDYNNFTTCPNFSAFPIINNYFVDKLVGKNRDAYTGFYFSFANKMIPALYMYGKYQQSVALFDFLKNIYSEEMSNVESLQMFLNLYWSNYLERNDREQILNDISQYIKISYLLKEENMSELSENLKNNSQYIYDKYLKYYYDNILPEFQTFYDSRIKVLQKNY